MPNDKCSNCGRPFPDFDNEGFSRVLRCTDCSELICDYSISEECKLEHLQNKHNIPGFHEGIVKDGKYEDI